MLCRKMQLQGGVRRRFAVSNIAARVEHGDMSQMAPPYKWHLSISLHLSPSTSHEWIGIDGIQLTHISPRQLYIASDCRGAATPLLHPAPSLEPFKLQVLQHFRRRFARVSFSFSPLPTSKCAIMSCSNLDLALRIGIAFARRALTPPFPDQLHVLQPQQAIHFAKINNCIVDTNHTQSVVDVGRSPRGRHR